MYFEFSLRGLLTAFFRKKDIFVLIFSLVVLAGAIYLERAPQVYESKGAFLIRFGQGALPTVGSADGKTTEFSRDDREEIIQSNVMLLQSEDLLKDVIRSVGLEKIYPGITAGMKSAEIAEQSPVIRCLRSGQEQLAVAPQPRRAAPPPTGSHVADEIGAQYVGKYLAFRARERVELAKQLA